MMVFRPGDRLHVTAGPEGARLMLLGGETLGGPRYIWWNFVASSQERIEAAKEAWRAGDWEHGRFQLPPGRRRGVHPAAGRAGGHAAARGQVAATAARGGPARRGGSRRRATPPRAP